MLRTAFSALLLFTATPQKPAVQPQPPASTSITPTSSPSPDSIRFRAQSTYDSLYIVMLERTNSQLSLRWNPLGVFIGALGVLFTVLAIGTAVALYRQGRDYKLLLNEELAKYQKVLNDFIADRKAQLELLSQDIAAQLEAAKLQLTVADAEDKDRLKEHVTRLEARVNSIRAVPTAPAAPSSAASLLEWLDSAQTGAGSPKPALAPLPIHQCRECGRMFAAAELLKPVGLLGTPVQCPYCKFTELVSS